MKDSDYSKAGGDADGERKKKGKGSTLCSETDKGQHVTKHPSSLIHDKGRAERMLNPQKGKTGRERTRGETDCEKWR